MIYSGLGGVSSEFSKPEFSGSLEVNEIKLKMTFNIDNVDLLNLHPNKRVKSCRLSVIKSIIFSVFNNSNCAQS